MPRLIADRPVLHTSSELSRVADDVAEAARRIAQRAGTGVRA